MKQEYQRYEPFLRVGIRIGEFGLELLDLVDDARLGWTARRDAAGW